jgi:hypothetical protein
MTDTGPGTFALSEAYFARLRRTMLWTGAAVVSVALVAGAFPGPRGDAGWVPVVVILAVVAPILFVSLHFSYRKQAARWRTFRITVDGDRVLRTQEGHDDVMVTAASISRLVRIPARGLLIYAGKPQPAITIPDTLDRFEECSALVGRFRPIEVKARSFVPRWAAFPAGLAAVAAWTAFERVQDVRVKVGLGAFLAGALVFGLWRLRGNPDVDSRTKRRLAWTTALVILPVAMAAWKAWNTPRRMEQAIRDDRLLSLLVKARPDLQDRLRDALVQAERNKSDASGKAYVNPAASVVAEALPDYLPICSDEAIIRYAKETLTIIERLEADPSDICYEWLHPQGRAVPVEQVLGRNGLDALVAAVTEVVQSGLENPQPAPLAIEAEGLRTDAIVRLAKETTAGPSDGRAPDVQSNTRKASCREAERVFRAYLDLPEKQSSVVLRHVLANAMRRP